MFRNVVVGVDGSEGGRDAIALAGRLAQAQTEITLAYVFRGRRAPMAGTPSGK